MNIKQKLTTLLLLFAGASVNLFAQTTITYKTDGSFSGSSDWKDTWTSSTTPVVTISAPTGFNAGNGYMATGRTFTMTVGSGYIIKSYTITGGSWSSTTVTPVGGSATTFLDSDNDAKVLTVDNINASSTSFSVGGASNLKVASIVITVDEAPAITPTASEVYTINNTNTNRGALTYEPAKSTKYVWSSGKPGATAFDATNPNHQWVIIPTGTADRYYLYNVGAKKFAVPTTGGTYDGVCWKYSYDAAPVALTLQTSGTYDGTYQIYAPYGDRYMSVSNNYVGPIINFTSNNDSGQFFTITKVGNASSDVTTQVTTAVNRLVSNRTSSKLTATSQFTSEGGWYVIKVNNGNWVGHSFFTAEEEITYSGTHYPIGFYGYGYEDASIASSERLFRIASTTGGYTWQLPNGKYLYNPEKSFPVSTTASTDINISKTDAGFAFYQKSTGANQYTRYAIPYLLDSKYFVGETQTATNLYDIYLADLSAAGLQPWQILCNNAPETAKITCNRSDVSGLTSVYKNGYIFLPTGVTPESSDFVLAGSTNITVDATAHTVTIAYDPSMAIVADGVSVEQGWQTAGRGNSVYLLRVTASPFKAATNVSITASLKDGTESQISGMTLYEASSNSTEILGSGSDAPTMTQVSTATISGTTATFSINSLSVGTHYYWIATTVKSDATLGSVLDAAVTGITYTCNNNETTLDLTSIGDPADRGAMVFNTRTYPFLPWDDNSKVYRIPAMVVADDGSIIVAADKRYNSHTDLGSHKIDVVVRRSTDGGVSWSTPVIVATGDGSSDAAYGYGDPSFVKCADGKIICLFAAGKNGFGSGLHNVGMVTSSDNGETWSEVVDITTRSDKWTNNSGETDFFVTSGKGLYTNDGVIMFLIDANRSNETNYVLYSTDEGESWTIDATKVCTGANEAKLEQLNDGSLIASIRTSGKRAFNRGTYVKNANGTVTFTWGAANGDITYSETLKTSAGNNQDIFYYQRSSATGKTDVIFHSMTMGNHANLKLFYSLDQGANWTEFLNVQTKGTRYVVMAKGASTGTDSETNPGSLYLFFEDQSLNAAGGYTDYNHYPLNFLEITREQLESLIPTLDDYNVSIEEDVKVVYGMTAHTTYGTLNGLTWTSKVTSNVATGDNSIAGLTMVASDGAFDKFSNWNSHYNIAYHPATANTDATLTLTAPAGYVIKSYSMLVARASSTSHTYTVTTDAGTSTDVPFGSNASSYATVSQSNINAASTTITVNTNDVSKWLAIADFTVTLAKTLPLNVVGDASYTTLYLPFDVTTTGTTKAYYITTANNGSAQLTPTESEGTKIPARTAVVLINSEAAENTALNKTSGLSAIAETNILKGTFVPMSLDLGDSTPNYALGKKDNTIGFYKFDDGNGTTSITLGANKAYLEVPSANVKGFVFDFDDATGISDLSDKSDMSDESDIIYNLAGQKVNGKLSNGQLPRGIYIINGKKILK